MKKSGKIIFLISFVLVAISLVVCGFWHWQEGHYYNVELYEFSENAVFSDLAHVDGVDYRYQIDENSPAHYIVRYSYDTKKQIKSELMNRVITIFQILRIKLRRESLLILRLLSERLLLPNSIFTSFTSIL